MLQELSTKTSVAQVGEEIGLDLGTQMVRSYQEANPTDVKTYMIGREIIERILSQPGCVGIKFFNAYNELGQKTLVYAGVDSDAKVISKFTFVDNEGILRNEKGIIADRVRTDDGAGSGWDWWKWLFD